MPFNRIPIKPTKIIRFYLKMKNNEKNIKTLKKKTALFTLKSKYGHIMI